MLLWFDVTFPTGGGRDTPFQAAGFGRAAGWRARSSPRARCKVQIRRPATRTNLTIGSTDRAFGSCEGCSPRLPLGDSITHGFSSTDDAGYRSPLFKLIVAANQNVTFIGSLTNGPTT